MKREYGSWTSAALGRPMEFLWFGDRGRPVLFFPTSMGRFFPMQCNYTIDNSRQTVTVSVAAASILAKVTRDRIMVRLHKRYPAFGFDRNKGYGSAEHRAVIAELGPTPVHRLSFQGVGQTELPGLAVPVPAGSGVDVALP